MLTYRINSPYVVSEVFVDDEAAVINLKTGNYYSLNKTATQIWSLIEKGSGLSEITHFISTNFDVDESFEETEIEQFIKKLTDEGLIAAEEDETLKSGDPGNGHGPAVGMEVKRAYESPILECYADMQELLLLDPIHEVEETNWLVNKPQ